MDTRTIRTGSDEKKIRDSDEDSRINNTRQAQDQIHGALSEKRTY